MKLRDYLRAHGVTVKAFAESIGEPHTVVRKWAYGQRQPSLPNAVKVETATGGKVTSRDMLLADVDTTTETVAVEA